MQSDSSIKLIPRSVKNLTSNLFLSESKNNSATSEAAEKICARNRWVIKKALRDSQDKSLNLFSLISKGLLKEMPNCPDGGNYELEKSEETRIRCSRHGITPDR